MMIVVLVIFLRRRKLARAHAIEESRRSRDNSTADIINDTSTSLVETNGVGTYHYLTVSILFQCIYFSFNYIIIMWLSLARRINIESTSKGWWFKVDTKSCSNTRTMQYCGQPSWSRGSVLGRRPSGPESRFLCLDGSVISFISPSSEVPGMTAPPNSFTARGPVTLTAILFPQPAV